MRGRDHAAAGAWASVGSYHGQFEGEEGMVLETIPAGIGQFHARDTLRIRRWGKVAEWHEQCAVGVTSS